MNNDIPVYDGQALDPEDARLKTLFDEMKKNQLTFLDEAGKRIIELSTGLLGLIFGVIAFGKDFPPPYFKANPTSQGLATGVLIALVLAILFGVLTVQPRSYKYNKHNLTSMKDQYNNIFTYKSRCMIAAAWAFFIGALLLAVLVGVLVRSA
jgi:CDP-diglyceride synthetase